MNFIYKTFATFFGAGYAPLAPGTFGALFAAGFVYLWQTLQPELSYYHWPLLIVTILAFFLGAYCTDQLAEEWGKDPSKVVIDEAIGLWISILFVPVNTVYLVAGLILFRIFDIWKPLGIRKMENIKGGWGVMMDDVLAGVYANIILQIYLLLS